MKQDRVQCLVRPCTLPVKSFRKQAIRGREILNRDAITEVEDLVAIPSDLQ